MAGKWTKARLIASCGVLVGGMWGASMALFTDSAVSSTGSFTAGSVDINASDASTVLTASDMAPGDAVYGEITVSNSGTLDASYDMSSAAAGDLATALQVTVKTGGTCDATNFGGTGTAVAGPANLSTIAFADRALAASGSEVLCFEVLLPATAGNDAQGDAASATFTFSAENV